MSEAHAEDAAEVSGARPRRLRRRWLALGAGVVAIAFVGVTRPAVRPYTLDLRDPVCINMFPIGAWSAVGPAEPGWSYIAGEPIPDDWIGREVDGTLISWSTGARFFAEGATVAYTVTGKWGPCHSPPIE